MRCDMEEVSLQTCQGVWEAWAAFIDLLSSSASFALKSHLPLDNIQ